MRKNNLNSFSGSERSSLNKENMHPLQAHYQQYLQQQQQNQRLTGCYSTSNNSNNHFHSSVEMSLSQSAASDTNQTCKQIESQRSSRLNISKKSLPQNHSSQQNFVQNSSSSKGTPSFQHSQRVKKGLTNMPNSNIASHKNLQNQNVKQQSIKRKPQNTPMLVDMQAQNNFHIFQNKNGLSSSQSKGSKGFTQTNKSMKAAHKKNQPSNTSNTSSAQVNQHFQQTNKHLRFDSIQDSSSATHQLMSITSQHYQGLISGSSSDIDNQENMDDNMRDFREAIMTESPQQYKQQLTLSNSLLECVDQYGNNIDQYSVLMESDKNTSSKKELVSELNNPYSYLNSVTKDLRGYGSIHQEDGVNVYNVQLANIVNNPNFVVCSPSVQTEDDCQYTNSSAMRSINTGNSAIKNNHSSYNKRQAKLIYTDDRKEEDLSSQAIDEMDQNDKGCFSSEDKDQFTGDNEDEEIESKLNMITGSSQIYQTKDNRGKDTNFVPDSNSNERAKFQYVQQTPGQQNQYFQVLDTDSRQNIINDTPQVMQMIDQSNYQSSRTRKSQIGDQQSNMLDQQLSPEVLGSRENRRAQKQENNNKDQTRNSSRYLNFKDISPLVKSCNTFAFDNTLQNQSTLEMNMMGKISPPFLQNHIPSLLQKDNQKFNNTMQTNSGTNSNNLAFGQTLNPQVQQSQNQFKNYHTTQGTLVNIHDKDMLSPNNFQRSTTQKQSSIMESPPPLTETSPEKGIKDFSRQYLHHGMWPSKLSQNGNGLMFSNIQDISVLSSNRGTNNSMRMGEQIKRLENQMSSISKKIYVNQQQQQNSNNNPLYSTGDMLTQSQTNATFQNPTQPSNLNQIQEKLNTMYPNIDQSIVQKINTTLDNMNNQFYFKRPSDHIGLGNSSITQHKISRDHSKSNNISGINLLNNFNNPNQIGTYPHNTMGNNTVFNQSSFDDICNNGDQISNITQIHNNDPYGAPLTSRSNNTNALNTSKFIPHNTSTISNNQNNISQSQIHKSYQTKSNNTSQINPQTQQLRFSNVSDPVKKITLNGFGLGNINQKMQGQESTTNQGAFNTFDNITTSSQQNQQQHQNYVNNGMTSGHLHHNQSSVQLCKECLFEKEKRQVTQKAFERALGISMFLMEEIDKLNIKQGTNEGMQQTNTQNQGRPSNISDSTANNQLQVSRQEIMNLMNQTQYLNLKNQVSPGSLNGDTTTHHNSQTRLSRSKSQSMMPVEYANLQRSLQIPRGAFPGIFNNITPNLSYI